MAYEALYSRTRPRNLSQLVGQEHISLPLTRAVNLDRLAHAYLLVGTRGTGKTSTARLMARAVNCDVVAEARAENRELLPKEIPCGKCESCLHFDSSPDNIEFDAASNRSVEDITRLLSTVYLAPMQARVKTFIIDEVHMLSFEAVNSILKLIEEPPDNVIFFLATTEYNKVPLTIRSRCQVLNFKLIAQEKIAMYIEKLGQLMHIEVTPDAARKLARLARGSMRDAMSLLDQCYSMIGEKLLTLQLVDETLGLIADSDLDELINAVRNKDRLKISEITAKISASGITAINFNEELITRLRDLITALTDGQSEEFYVYERMIDQLRKAAVEMRASGIADIILETTLLKLASDAMRFQPVEMPQSKPATQTSAPEVSPADKFGELKQELGAGQNSSESEYGKKILNTLSKYFKAEKKLNITSMLVLASSSSFKDDTLKITFKTVSRMQMFETNCRKEVQEVLDALFERRIEMVVESLEPPVEQKKSFTQTLTQTKGKTRKNILKMNDIFGNVDENDNTH